jgi:soluble lytic murein transglycosylase-like protein
MVRRISGLITLCCFAAALHAETIASRTTVVVKADQHSGRLIRSAVVAPRAVSAVDPDKPAEQAAPVVESLAQGSIGDMIDAIARNHDVEAQLVHSVIKAESNYNPAAISPKGAQGLMQLIPSTARRFGVSNSFNVQQNIEGGVRYLKFLLDLYHNDYVKVIAAYNAGEGAVTKYGGIPPYNETMTYVTRVARNLRSGRQLAEQKAKVLVAAPLSQEANLIRAIVAEDGKVYYKTQ